MRPITERRSLFVHSHTFCAVSPPYGVNTSCEERIGLTKFRVANNASVLGAIFEPGGFVSICYDVQKALVTSSAPFGVSVTALFRLFPVTTLAMIHFTFSITLLS